MKKLLYPLFFLVCFFLFSCGCPPIAMYSVCIELTSTKKLMIKKVTIVEGGGEKTVLYKSSTNPDGTTGNRYNCDMSSDEKTFNCCYGENKEGEFAVTIETNKQTYKRTVTTSKDYSKGSILLIPCHVKTSMIRWQIEP